LDLSLFQNPIFPLVFERVAGSEASRDNSLWPLVTLLHADIYGTLKQPLRVSFGERIDAIRESPGASSVRNFREAVATSRPEMIDFHLRSLNAAKRAAVIVPGIVTAGDFERGDVARSLLTFSSGSEILE
jgi:hypothetical protein